MPDFIQVMVSENADGSIAKLSDPAKDLQGHRSTVDQVAYQPESIPAGVELDLLHQILQGPEASVNVTDRESSHGMETTLKQRRRSGGAGQGREPPDCQPVRGLGNGGISGPLQPRFQQPEKAGAKLDQIGQGVGKVVTPEGSHLRRRWRSGDEVELTADFDQGRGYPECQ